MNIALAATRQALTASPSSRRWITLSVVAVAQLMIALDATVVSIAMPSAQRALGASDAERQWIVTAYTLAFGSLLLLGGRVADAVGRKPAFLAGLSGFALASAAGGAAPSFGVLVAARFAQGASAALLAPTALSLLAVTFTEPHERARAFSVYGAIAGSGAAVGLLLGGLLTQYLSWRWCLYINVPIAATAAAGSWLLLGAEDKTRPALRQFDVPGALLGGGALGALCLAFSAAVTEGWASRAVVGLLALAAALAALFVLRETHAAVPLLPLRIVVDRARGGVYLVVAMAIAAMFGAFLFLTYYLQVVLHYTPVEAGLAFLPLAAASQLGSWGIASRLMPRLPPRAIMAPGALLAAAGMALLTLVQANGAYLSHVLPAEVLLGAGIACVMVPAFSTATLGVDRSEAGVASAAVNTAQQVGGSAGTALLNTVAAGATAGYLASRGAGPDVLTSGLVHGYSVAAGWAAAILILAALAAATLINTGRPAAFIAGGTQGSSR